jgi:[ribosomal protein S18]-alanine N-acetyltransferase
MIDLERSCPTAAHWDERRYQELFHPGAAERLALVAEETPGLTSVQNSSSPTVVGFLIARHVASEWELENIVVAPEARRKGLGKRLLEALFARARQLGGDAVFLEVRASNAAARSLYQEAGFEPTGRRKSYYTDPLEDALLYRMHLF